MKKQIFSEILLTVFVRRLAKAGLPLPDGLPVWIQDAYEAAKEVPKP